MASDLSTTKLHAVTNATYRVLGENGIAVLNRLREHKSVLAERWRESPELFESFAVVSECDGEAGRCAMMMLDALPEIDASWRPLATLIVAHLLTYDAPRELVTQTLAAAEIGNDSPSLRGRIACDRGNSASMQRLWAQSEREQRSAIALFKSANDTLGMLESTIYLATNCSAQGRTSEAIELLLENFELIPPGGLLEIRASRVLARLYLDRLDFDRAEELLAVTKPLADASGVIDIILRYQMSYAEIAWWREDWNEARKWLDESCALSEQRGTHVYKVYALYALSHVELEAGEFEKAIDIARETAEMGAKIGITFMKGAAIATEAYALAALGRYDEALVMYRRIVPSNSSDGAIQFQNGLSAIIEILLARAARTEVDKNAFLESAKANIQKLVARNDQGTRWCESSLQLRLVARRARRYAELVDLHRPFIEKARPVAIDREGRFILLENQEHISIEHRPVLQRVLVCLANAAASKPGTTVAFEELIAAAWPNDRASQNSLRARLRVAISTLRQLALEDAIATHESGYALTLPPPSH